MLSAAEILDEMITDLKRREESLLQIMKQPSTGDYHGDLLQAKRNGVRIAIDLLMSRRKDLPTC